MNVTAGDLALLVGARHPENQGKICTVKSTLEDSGGDPTKRWWLCVFPRPVKTDRGFSYESCVQDKDLQRIAGPSLNLDADTWEDISIREPEPICI